jgi:hypothetical protein
VSGEAPRGSPSTTRAVWTKKGKEEKRKAILPKKYELKVKI